MKKIEEYWLEDLFNLFINSSIHSLFYLLVQLLISSLIHSLIRSLIHSFTQLLIHSLIHSITLSFLNTLAILTFNIASILGPMLYLPIENVIQLQFHDLSTLTCTNPVHAQ